MNEVLIYAADSWAVKRWDKVSGGAIPRSFCQFWRTVVLWATVASIPFIGRPFRYYQPTPRVVHEYDGTWLDVLATGGEAFWALFAAIVKVVANGVWIVAKPLRIVAYWLWRGVVTVVEYLSRHADQHKEPIARVIRGASIVLFSIAVLAALGALGYLTYLASLDQWKMIGAIVASAVGLAIAFGFLLLILVVIAEPLRSAWQLGVDIAVTSKRRVCPPMQIEGRNAPIDYSRMW